MKTIHLLVALLALSFAANASEQAPSCPVKTLDGKRSLDLADGQGKIRYVDFWASWCGPCASSFPFMNALHSELASRGVEIIGVNLDENREDALAFLEKPPPSSPSSRISRRNAPGVTR
jgi:thiol-disulfide isomerase/thioredoxin